MNDNSKSHNCDCGCNCADDVHVQLDEAKKAAENNLKMAKYAAAELENYRKRNVAANQNAFNDGKTLVVMSILPVMDSFSDAIKLVADEKSKEGLNIMHRKFESILTGLGLEEIPCKRGDTFNPHEHDCVATSPNSNNTVKEIWQKGYKFAGRVLRPVTVKI